MTKTIYYLGETTDYSDQWLINELREQFKVDVYIPAECSCVPSDYSLIINRMYGSAVSRYGIKKIKEILKFIKTCKSTGTPIINSSFGYILESNRINQYQFFLNAGLNYVPTVTLNNHASSFFPEPPYVIKDNYIYRNKTLSIIQNLDELTEIKREINKQILIQPIINSRICYRTEFIGGFHITFPQKVAIQSDHLSFKRTEEIIQTPLELKTIDKIRGIINSIGVQTFSIEYFLIEKNNPKIVDFNINSNYPPFLIKKAGHLLRKAWTKTIMQI